MKKKYIIISCILVLVIAFDLITKIFSHNWHDVVIIKNILSFNYVENTGAAFSMFAGNQIWLTIISIVLIVGFVLYDLLAKNDHMLYNIAFAFIVGGAIGNLIDRIFLGYVRDFIQPDFIDFATFNVADSFLTIGAILLCIFIIFFNKKGKQNDK